MKNIISKIAPKCTWLINNKRDLTDDEIVFIEQFDPHIYHNDLTCKLWEFDTKMPSGAWLENIEFNNELTKVKALVI